MSRISPIPPLAAVVLIALVIAPADSSAAPEINSGKVEFNITVDAPEGADKVRLWTPYPQSDEHQTIENLKVLGNFARKRVTTDKESRTRILYLEWLGPMEEQRFVNITFHASSAERKVAPAPREEPPIPESVIKYTNATPLLPTDGEIGALASAAVEGKISIADKHSAIYSWVVENTFRDPNVLGCGVGAVEVTLAKRGGKCVDISTVYVTMARAAGVPAREVFGMRLGKEKGDNDVTGGHHCWAEYYQPGVGWVQTDPADVRKFMLNRGLTLEQASETREYYKSTVDPNRIVLGKTNRGIVLNPPQDGELLNYFMYPYAEIDGKPVEWLAAQKELKYTITYTRE
ncbi:MAG: transglutaminase domain-containing protein [Nitrospinota bacterium]|nr:transglutaminase domain-containing protein [Nitrospinota bacterium]